MTQHRYVFHVTINFWIRLYDVRRKYIEAVFFKIGHPLTQIQPGGVFKLHAGWSSIQDGCVVRRPDAQLAATCAAHQSLNATSCNWQLVTITYSGHFSIFALHCTAGPQSNAVCLSDSGCRRKRQSKAL